jgi:hypothetical protein
MAFTANHHCSVFSIDRDKLDGEVAARSADLGAEHWENGVELRTNPTPRTLRMS